MSCWGFSDVYVKSCFRVYDFGKGQLIVLKDYKLNEARKTGSVSLETQVLEEIRRIQDLVQFTCVNKTSKNQFNSVVRALA